MRAALLLVLTGCFGEGPTPSQPSEATTLFTLDLRPIIEGDCQPHPYIGHVAIGSDAGYVVTHAYVPACSGGGGGNMTPIPSTVFQFGKTAPSRMKIGDAGMVQGGGGAHGRVAALGGDAVWIYTEQMSNSVFVRSKSNTFTGTFTSSAMPTSVIGDGATLFVGASPAPTGPANANSPRFPCCGTSNPMGSYSFFQLSTALAVAALPVTPKFFYEQVKDSLVANTNTLFYVEHTNPGASIRSQPKNGSAGEVIGTLAGQPAGLAADDAHIAWSATPDFTLASPGMDNCFVAMTTVDAPRTETMLLSTSAFSCLDLALDGDAVYFTIVELLPGDGDDLLGNVGIGRVNLATREFESVALGIATPQVGPRQLFIDGDGLIVVAPFAIARIAKSALDGAHDIAK